MTDWFGGLLDTVRQKSEVIINMYKEDLQEFTSTITEDTKKAIETNSTAVNAIGGLTNIIQQISGNSTNNNTNSEEKSVPHLDPSMYSKEPEDSEDYHNWVASFDIKAKTDEISQLLASDEHMRNLHRELVPATVTYGEFWKRYFYYYSKMKEKEDRRAALLQRANEAIASDANDDELGWDLDEFESAQKERGEEEEEDTSPATTSNHGINEEDTGVGDHPSPSIHDSSPSSLVRALTIDEEQIHKSNETTGDEIDGSSNNEYHRNTNHGDDGDRVDVNNSNNNPVGSTADDWAEWE